MVSAIILAGASEELLVILFGKMMGSMPSKWHSTAQGLIAKNYKILDIPKIK